MADLFWQGVTYPLDEHGFLSDPGRWDMAFVEGTARCLELPEGLTLLHWRPILFVRKHFVMQFDVARIYETCRHSRLSLKRLRQLFPPGYQRGVCRLAGIPYKVIENCHYALTYETSPARRRGLSATPPGFLVNPGDWDHGFAREAAKNSGIETLTPKH